MVSWMMIDKMVECEMVWECDCGCFLKCFLLENILK